MARKDEIPLSLLLVGGEQFISSSVFGDSLLLCRPPAPFLFPPPPFHHTAPGDRALGASAITTPLQRTAAGATNLALPGIESRKSKLLSLPAAFRANLVPLEGASRDEEHLEEAASHFDYLWLFKGS